MERANRSVLILLTVIILALIACGIIADGLIASLQGFWRLQLAPGRLIQDFIAVAGIGGTLINAALSGAVALIVIIGLKVSISGPTFAAVLTIIGFGFFGKTPLNIIPIIAGVFLAASYAGKQVQEYLIIALFGTALGPIVSFVLFEFALSAPVAIPLAIVIGLLSGFLLPPLAFSILNFHQGYNLYNMGMTCGFFALFAASFFRATGHTFATSMAWYSGDNLLPVLLVPVLSLILVITALRGGVKKAFTGLREITRLPGRLPSDFMDMVSFDGALLNSGLLGLAGTIYLLAIGADFSGPVIGGLLTVMGFGAFGTHVKNSWPVVLGVVGGTVLFGWELSSPGPVLAALFGTTLAPVAGQFGIIPGLVAGVIHIVMVMQTGAWQGGINLYNNGFAGGLTAALLVAFIQWRKANRKDF